MLAFLLEQKRRLQRGRERTSFSSISNCESGGIRTRFQSKAVAKRTRFLPKAEPSADAKALAKAEAKAEAKAGATSKALCVGHCYMIAKAETQAGAEERALSAKSVGKSARAS